MNGRPDNLSAPRLLDLLKQQSELYRRLRVLAWRQKALAAQEDVRPITELLAERQKLVDGLMSLNSALTPCRRNWTERYGGLDAPTRRQVAALLEEANESFSAVLPGDQQDNMTGPAPIVAKREWGTAVEEKNRRNGQEPVIGGQ